MPRCHWVTKGDELYEKYHDLEWGVPVVLDEKIFEFLVLESFQAGLSWRTILYKREAFRQAFKNFNPETVSGFGESDIERLMNDDRIVRNRLKILAAINNAKCFLDVKKEFGSFSKYMWNWVGGQTIRHSIESPSDVPVYDEIALAWSKDLKKRGFKFLGPTVVYAHMQATGMVNDHLNTCAV